MQGNALGSIFYVAGGLYNPELYKAAVTGVQPSGRKLQTFLPSIPFITNKPKGPDGFPDPYGFIPAVRAIPCHTSAIVGAEQSEAPRAWHLECRQIPNSAAALCVCTQQLLDTSVQEGGTIDGVIVLRAGKPGCVCPQGQIPPPQAVVC